MAMFPGIERPSVDERLALIEEIQESLRADESSSPPDEAYIVEMERRLADSKAHPENLVSWDEAIKARLSS